ncbi:MAG TPA: iron-sulfur cluster assembly accessory protein [Euryarchaeota archaeon]|nr:iron-sulfur cluster assembly accessory protein [Euryarchaeota archaeon]
MLEVTEAALKGIHQMMEEDQKVGAFLRVYAAGMSCSGIQYAIAYEDNVKDDDEKMVVDGVTFVMDDLTIKDLDKATLDFMETPEGGGLYFSKPSSGCSSCSSCQ